MLHSITKMICHANRMVPLPYSKLLLTLPLQLSAPAPPSLGSLILGSLLPWPRPEDSSHSFLSLANCLGLLGFGLEGLLCRRPSSLAQPMQAPAMAPWPPGLTLLPRELRCIRGPVDRPLPEGGGCALPQAVAPGSNTGRGLAAGMWV